jgi:hypothetical protein
MGISPPGISARAASSGSSNAATGILRDLRDKRQTVSPGRKLRLRIDLN